MLISYFRPPSTGTGVQREVYSMQWDALRNGPNVQARMGNYLLFRPQALTMGIQPTLNHRRTSFAYGAFATLSVIVLGHLPERFSPIQWLWALYDGNRKRLTSDILRMFLPELVEVVEKIQMLPTSSVSLLAFPWLVSFWTSFVENIPVCFNFF